ncbi:mitochondrial carrier domain-containing protein [Dichotomocladium elegans]|nr:mitochondrial carrier domain-containing protein [Dichotomocladium elegans]
MFQDDSEPWSLQKLFTFLDHNNDGHIDVNDLNAICASTEAPINEAAMNKLRNQVTVITKTQGRMSYDEFAQLVSSHAIPSGEITTDHIERIVHIIPNAISQTAENKSWKMIVESDTFKHLVAGGLAGAVSRTVVSPVERMKILFQVQGPEPAAYQGVFPTLAKMWREEGFMGLMRGNGTNVIRIIPYSASQFAAYEYSKSLLMEPGKTELDTPRRLTAGGIAGVVSVACTYPLDMVRTRLSVLSATLEGNMRGTGAPQKKLPGILPLMIHIYKNEGGWLGLYRGLWPTTLGVAPYVAINFQCYEGLKFLMIPEGSDKPSSTRKLVCGAVAGCIAQTITYPLDVLRRRMQVTGMATIDYKYKGTWDAIKTMVRNEGVRGLYKGMIPNYLKVAPAMGVSFVTYEWCKDAMNGR